MQLTDVDDIIEVMLEVEKGEYKAIEKTLPERCQTGAQK